MSRKFASLSSTVRAKTNYKHVGGLEVRIPAGVMKVISAQDTSGTPRFKAKVTGSTMTIQPDVNGRACWASNKKYPNGPWVVVLPFHEIPDWDDRFFDLAVVTTDLDDDRVLTLKLPKGRPATKEEMTPANATPVAKKEEVSGSISDAQIARAVMTLQQAKEELGAGLILSITAAGSVSAHRAIL